MSVEILYKPLSNDAEESFVIWQSITIRFTSENTTTGTLDSFQKPLG